MTRVDAALQAGISHRTFTSWMARGETGEEPYAAFHGEVVKAEMTAQRRLLGHVTKAACPTGDPRHGRVASGTTIPCAPGATGRRARSQLSDGSLGSERRRDEDR